MEPIKNCHQEAFKPITIGKDTWMASDEIDFSSKETTSKMYNEVGLLKYELKNGIEEKTKYRFGFPVAKYYYNINSNLVKETTFHYNLDAKLIKITHISCLDNFEVEYLDQEYFYEEGSVICLHYLYNKPSYYKKTTHSVDKKIVDYWHANKKPYQKCVYYYKKNKVMTELMVELPSNRIVQYWKYKYNSNGNCLEIQRFNNTKVAEHCQIFEYDKYNNCIREHLVFKPKGKLLEETITKYEYDAMGNWIRKVIYKNGNIQYFVDNKILEK